MKKKVKSASKILKENEKFRVLKRIELEKKYNKDKKENEQLWRRYVGNTPAPFPSKEAYVNEGLEEFDFLKKLVVTGRYRDPKKTVATYQQKFVEFTCQLCPAVIEELRAFVPLFDSLFGKYRDKYTQLFNWTGVEIQELLNIKFWLNQNFELLYTKHHEYDFRPDRPDKFNPSFRWGQFKLMLQIAFLLLVQVEDRGKEKCINEIIDSLEESLETHDQFIRGKKDTPEQNEFRSIHQRVLLDFVTKSSEEFITFAQPILKRYLEVITGESEPDMDAFITLQLKLLYWAEQHKIEKDWVLKYAYFILWQFSNNRSLEISQLKIERLNVYSFVPLPFEFKFNGWAPEDEDAEDYEKHLKEKFFSEMDNYFQAVGRRLNLEKMIRYRAHKYEKVKWLVYANFKSKTAEGILEKFFPDIAAEKTKRQVTYLAYENKLKHIKSQIRSLANYDLPLLKSL